MDAHAHPLPDGDPHSADADPELLESEDGRGVHLATRADRDADAVTGLRYPVAREPVYAGWDPAGDAIVVWWRESADHDARADERPAADAEVR